MEQDWWFSMSFEERVAYIKNNMMSDPETNVSESEFIQGCKVYDPVVVVSAERGAYNAIGRFGILLPMSYVVKEKDWNGLFCDDKENTGIKVKISDNGKGEYWNIGKGGIVRKV